MDQDNIDQIVPNSSLIKSQLSLLKKRVNNDVKIESKLVSDNILMTALEIDTQNFIPSSHEVQNTNLKEDTNLKVNSEANNTLKPINLSYMKVQWTCTICSNDCIPVQSESRCMCGHRLKGHKSKDKHKTNPTLICETNGCKCKDFFYIVAEGAWMLRCRCKHKTGDHDCSKYPYKCLKCNQCSNFDSPWICNCGHQWNTHQQTILCKEINQSNNNIDNNTNDTKISKRNFSVRQDGTLPQEGF